MRIVFLLIALVLGSLFITLFNKQQTDFNDVRSRLTQGTMVNLNAPAPGKHLAAMLKKGYYFEDDRDIALIEKIVDSACKASPDPIDNIGELNKRRFFVNADLADKVGGEVFKKRVADSRSLLGYTGNDAFRFEQERVAPPRLNSILNLKKGEHSISGKILDTAGAPVEGVLIKLRMILPQDSLLINDEEGAKAGGLLAYNRTSKSGAFSFDNLPDQKAFQVLPLKPGYQFGRSQGIESLNKDFSVTFKQTEHTIRLLSSRDFKTLKKERSLIVRTPEDYNFWYWTIVSSFLSGFLLLHFLLEIRFPKADKIILPVIFVMTGLSFLTLLSLQDPLRDRFLGKDTLLFFGIGIAGIIVLLFINFRKFHTDSLFYRMVVLRHQKNGNANGWQWAGLGLALLSLTLIFGNGPEGSGVKVNLLGVQPSEVVKYAIILFLAGYFASNEKFISAYFSWKKRWYFFSFALLSMLLSILLYLMLGDLGPAMVICFTFIILFSFSRGDFVMMVFGIITYVFSVWLLNIWIATLLTLTLLCAVMFLGQKRMSESAIMIFFVISGFLLIDQIPYLDKLIPGPVRRLTERKSIWQDPWNNEVYGGDQVANGIWAISGGDFMGQGIGEGFAKNIPEAHTDMILPAIGEEFGGAGIIAIFVLFLCFLYRAVTIGRKTGAPFLFYLCSGIGVSTFVQFLLIAGGSTGALPLSGVALPFISYGGSSLVANMLAAGVLLSVSQIKGSKVQMEFLTKQQDKNLVPALLSAMIAVVLLSLTVSRYILNDKKWIVEPALVADRSGLRMFSYNPRISILMSKLEAGQLYDRKGRILATSDPVLIKKQIKLLKSAGIHYDLDSAIHKRVSRFYPFEANTFFWTGDENTGVFMGSTNGYFAEYQHAAELRGFKSPTTSITTTANHYQEHRFLPEKVKAMTVSRIDFKSLAPLLLSGINSKQVKDFKAKNRDVRMTVDAGLQSLIQQSIAADDSLRKNRVSVVIMEDNTGDVLTSAVYPLPAIKDWEMLTMSVAEQNRLSEWRTSADLGFTVATQPGSTAKLVTSMAAFNKLGLPAANRTFSVSRAERIRTKGIEPDETGLITMEKAIVKSNNVYFIKLANEEHLEENMASLYIKTGMFLRGVGGYYFEKGPRDEQQEEKWIEFWRKTEFNTKPKYDPQRIRRTRAKGISGMAWGQGELIATPAAVARMASGIANDGVMIPNRFILKVSDSLTTINKGIKLAENPEYAKLITDYMLKQSAGKVYTLGLNVAGKTGTPERIWQHEQINDGWYVFFCPKKTGDGHIVVCIRIESTRGSSKAVLLAGEHVIPALLKLGYIQDFKNLPSFNKKTN